MESSIPILHTSHPSTGKCSGSKKNWHQTRNHPFTFTSFTWILECWSWKGVECRLSSADSARHRFSAPAAPHFWLQLLQIFGHSCCCSRFLTLLQECEGRQDALSGPPAGQLSNMRRKKFISWCHFKRRSRWSLIHTDWPQGWESIVMIMAMQSNGFVIWSHSLLFTSINWT